MYKDAPQEKDYEQEQRLIEAIKELRKEAHACKKHAFNAAKTKDTNGHYEAIKLLEWGYGITWAVDTLEYYLENGRMP